jgi:hypothetical protein
LGEELPEGEAMNDHAKALEYAEFWITHNDELPIRTISVCYLERDAQVKELRDTLNSVLDIAEDREDIEDGENGPRPNIWMRIAEECRAALGGKDG